MKGDSKFTDHIILVKLIENGLNTKNYLYIKIGY